MDYIIPAAGLVIVIAVLVFFVAKTLRQARELGFALGSSQRKIREISNRIKEIQAMDPDELTDDDKKKLAYLSSSLKKLSNNN